MSLRVRRSFNSRSGCEAALFDSDWPAVRGWRIRSRGAARFTEPNPPFRFYTLRDAKRKDIRSLQSNAVDSKAIRKSNATNGKR